MMESDKIMFEIYREATYTGQYRVVYFTELNDQNKEYEINRAMAGEHFYDGFIKNYLKDEAKDIIDGILKRYREDMVRNKQKQLTVDEQLRKFEEQLRAELAVADKYRGSEGMGDPNRLVQIAPPPQDHEMVAGD